MSDLSNEFDYILDRWDDIQKLIEGGETYVGPEDDQDLSKDMRNAVTMMNSYIEDVKKAIQHADETEEELTEERDTARQERDARQAAWDALQKLRMEEMEKAKNADALFDRLRGVAPAVQELAERIMTPHGQAVAAREARALAEKFAKDYPPKPKFYRFPSDHPGKLIVVDPPWNHDPKAAMDSLAAMEPFLSDTPPAPCNIFHEPDDGDDEGP